MKSTIFALMAVVVLVSSCSNPVSSKASGPTTVSSSVSGSAVYNTLDAANSTAWAAAVAAGGVRQGAVLVKVTPSFNSGVLSTLGAVQNGSRSGIGGTWIHLSVPVGAEPAVILALRTTPGVIDVEPELRLHIPESESASHSLGSSTLLGSSVSGRAASGVATGGVGVLINSPYVASAEYSLTIANAINSYTANNPANLTSTTYAAVIDTGLNMTHKGFYTTGGALVVAYAKSAFANNNNGTYSYEGDGSSFVPVPLGSNWDDDGHGTHVAGIIGAVGNNGAGTAGVLWNGLKLISYKVMTDNESDSSGGSGADWAVYGALYDVTNWWATPANHPDSAQGTLPVNMSLGGFNATPFEAEMITYALQHNVLVVAAMGNEGKTIADFPGAYTGVIAVGATQGNDAIAPFSSTGSWISVVAPGTDILSTYNGSSTDYEYDSGTSMAAPFVTGLVAYVEAFAPSLVPNQVKTVIMNSADLVSGSTGINSTYGAGRVNVYKTIQCATGSSVPASGSAYCSQPLVVNVTVGGSTTEAAGLPVYLYDASGNFIEAAYTGSPTPWYSYSAGSVVGPTGQVSFWLLTPGKSYTVKVNDGNSSATGTVTNLSSAGGTVTVNLSS